MQLSHDVRFDTITPQKDYSYFETNNKRCVHILWNILYKVIKVHPMLINIQKQLFIERFIDGIECTQNMQFE